MADHELVKRDQGGVNARILAREAKADFRRVEAASLKIPASFCSAEGKRLFIRHFASFQLSMHFISTIARMRLPRETILKVEALIRSQLEQATDTFNKAIDGAEALFQAHGVTTVATYDTVPLALEVGVMSSNGRRFLDVLGKLDQLMPLMQTLEIHEILEADALDHERAVLKRRVRDVANSARTLSAGLRREMNALDARRGGQASAGDVRDELSNAAMAEVESSELGPDDSAPAVVAADTGARPAAADAIPALVGDAGECHPQPTADAAESAVKEDLRPSEIA